MFYLFLDTSYLYSVIKYSWYCQSRTGVCGTGACSYR